MAQNIYFHQYQVASGLGSAFEFIWRLRSILTAQILDNFTSSFRVASPFPIAICHVSMQASPWIAEFHSWNLGDFHIKSSFSFLLPEEPCNVTLAKRAFNKLLNVALLNFSSISNLIATINDICPFSPQAQFFVKNFSTQKHKIDWSRKQRK